MSVDADQEALRTAIARFLNDAHPQEVIETLLSIIDIIIARSCAGPAEAWRSIEACAGDRAKQWHEVDPAGEETRH